MGGVIWYVGRTPGLHLRDRRDIQLFGVYQALPDGMQNNKLVRVTAVTLSTGNGAEGGEETGLRPMTHQALLFLFNWTSWAGLQRSIWIN